MKPGNRLLTRTGAALCAFLALAGCAREQSYDQRRQAILAGVERAAAQGPFRADWGSLGSFRVPAWYRDAKFGIFVHWGVYAVPAFESEWYPRNMYQQDSAAFKRHVAAYGPQTRFGYKDFIPQFRAEKFNANRWARLFSRAGAKFVVPVAEHCDGVAMYNCTLTDWSAYKMGPRRDVIGQLGIAVRRQGMAFGVSSHRAEHWWFFEGGKQFPSDVSEPRNAGLYGPAESRLTAYENDSQPDAAFLDDWLARTAEIVDRYQPQLLWFDEEIKQPVFQPYLQKFAAYYYNRGVEWKRDVAINCKLNSFPEQAAVLNLERGQVDAIRPRYWQTCASVSQRSRGYIQNDEYRTADSIVDALADIVSKNGALLLDVGPRADGTIPEQVEKILLEIGQWLAVNGEAIYGTRPWKIHGEENIRFTTKGGALYAIALAWPENARLSIKALAGEPVRSVQLLGSGARLKWSRDAFGLSVELPSQRPAGHALALKILQ